MSLFFNVAEFETQQVAKNVGLRIEEPRSVWCAGSLRNVTLKLPSQLSTLAAVELLCEPYGHQTFTGIICGRDREV